MDYNAIKILVDGNIALKRSCARMLAINIQIAEAISDDKITWVLNGKGKT
jgi:hypothetical protein